MRLVAACAALMLGVGVSIIYKDRIASENNTFARDCQARRSQVRLELNMRQCTDASSKRN